MSVDEVPEPSVEPGTVVVRPTATGICGSEIEGYLGKMGNRTPPLVMGHEFAGTVTEVGEGADEDLLGRLVAWRPGPRPPAGVDTPQPEPSAVPG